MEVGREKGEWVQGVACLVAQAYRLQTAISCVLRGENRTHAIKECLDYALGACAQSGSQQLVIRQPNEGRKLRGTQRPRTFRSSWKSTLTFLAKIAITRSAYLSCTRAEARSTEGPLLRLPRGTSTPFHSTTTNARITASGLPLFTVKFFLGCAEAWRRRERRAARSQRSPGATNSVRGRVVLSGALQRKGRRRVGTQVALSVLLE